MTPKPTTRYWYETRAFPCFFPLFFQTTANSHARERKGYTSERLRRKQERSRIDETLSLKKAKRRRGKSNFSNAS